MKGFFKNETKAAAEKKQKRAAKSKVFDCSTCGLDKGCISPYMKMHGNGRKDILWIAEAPGKTEDERGEQLVGDAGTLLRNTLWQDHRIDLDEDCYKINAVNCRPPENRTPTDREIACCRSRVWDVIAETKPKLIMLCGNPAIDSFLAHRWKKDKLDGITRWRGFVIPDRDVHAWVAPVFHPSYVLRNDKNSVIKTIWKKDLSTAMRHLRRKFPDFVDEKTIVRVLNEQDAIAALEDVYERKPELIGFDFETTGLKPHRRGHRIVYCAISIGENESFAFDVTDRTARILKKILADEKIGKTAHGLKFEHVWALEILGVEVKNWVWCSMNGVHINDNRKHISGLKFQVYVNFGIVDYDSHITPFLEGRKPGEDENSANAFNRVDEAPPYETKMYCGCDALFGRRIAPKQMLSVTLKSGSHKDRLTLQDAADLFHDGLYSMIEAESTGFRIDVDYCKKTQQLLTREIARCERRLMKDADIVKWKSLKGDDFNMNSDKQLREYLFDYKKLKPIKMTKGGNASADKSVLEELELPFAKDLVLIGKLQQSRDTFLGGILREVVDDRMRAFYHLHTVTSYRSSSSDPNQQNVPVRDQQAQEMVRRAFYPSRGRRILEIDFSGAEVNTSCCVHRDPKMMDDVQHGDMHRDLAIELYLLEDEDMDWSDKKSGKWVRFSAKNGFTFAEFYGDWYQSCAAALWKMIKELALKTTAGRSMYDHLRRKGIKELRCADCERVEASRSNRNRKQQLHRSDKDCCFENHVRRVEDRFWNERFKIYAKWRKDFFAEYQQNGYFDLVTGFRCTGVYDKKQVCNFPIQGPSFHCMLWSLNRIRKIEREEKWDTKIMGQIHDSMLFDCVSEELEYVIKTANRVISEELPAAWSWIVMPFTAEAEAAPIDASWFHKEKLG